MKKIILVLTLLISVITIFSATAKFNFFFPTLSSVRGDLMMASDLSNLEFVGGTEFPFLTANFDDKVISSLGLGVLTTGGTPDFRMVLKAGTYSIKGQFTAGTDGISIGGQYATFGGFLKAGAWIQPAFKLFFGIEY
ncbi:MAG: hypothetical protein ACQESN_05945 [Thermotogota bacterium]